MAESGEMEENARPIDPDDLKPEELELLTKAFPTGRTLQ
jgi:hypothetical protein